MHSWRPQSSGKVERMNQTLKRQISKICQETNLKWPQALPLALLQIRVQPKSGTSVSPYEVLYGKPYKSPEPNPNIHVKGKQDVYTYLLSLGKTLAAIQSAVIWNKPLSLENSVHDFPTRRLCLFENMDLRTFAGALERTFPDTVNHLYSYQDCRIRCLDTLYSSEESTVKKAPTPWKIVNHDPKTLKPTLKHV